MRGRACVRARVRVCVCVRVRVRVCVRVCVRVWQIARGTTSRQKKEKNGRRERCENREVKLLGERKNHRARQTKKRSWWKERFTPPCSRNVKNGGQNHRETVLFEMRNGER